MSDADYSRMQTFFASKVTDLAIAALDNPGTRTLITPRSANERIYVQRITAYPSTYSVTTLTFQDGSGVGIGQILVPATGPLGLSVLEFGPTGTPLTLGATLVVVVVGGPLVCRIHIEAYEKLGAVTAA